VGDEDDGETEDFSNGDLDDDGDGPMLNGELDYNCLIQPSQVADLFLERGNLLIAVVQRGGESSQSSQTGDALTTQ
jgi:hypothetical protein